MVDTPPKGRHAQKHIRNASHTADKVEIQFSPEVVERLKDLEDAVRGSEHFDGDIFKNLEYWAAGKAGPVDLALTDIALITKETMNVVHKTGGGMAQIALDDLITDLIGRHHDSPPIATLKKHGASKNL